MRIFPTIAVAASLSQACYGLSFNLNPYCWVFDCNQNVLAAVSVEENVSTASTISQLNKPLLPTSFSGKSIERDIDVGVEVPSVLLPIDTEITSNETEITSNDSESFSSDIETSSLEEFSIKSTPIESTPIESTLTESTLAEFFIMEPSADLTASTILSEIESAKPLLPQSPTLEEQIESLKDVLEAASLEDSIVVPIREKAPTTNELTNKPFTKEWVDASINRFVPCGLYFIRRIFSGRNPISAIKASELNNKDVIRSIIWYLYEVAHIKVREEMRAKGIKGESEIEEMTFDIQDKNGVLYNYLATGHMTRLSSHYKEHKGEHRGIDFALGDLPEYKTHLLLGTLEKERFYAKPENYGVSGVLATTAHAYEFIVATMRKTSIGKKFGMSDDLDVYRKERVPDMAIKAFREIYSKLESDATALKAAISSVNVFGIKKMYELVEVKVDDITKKIAAQLQEEINARDMSKKKNRKSKPVSKDVREMYDLRQDGIKYLTNLVTDHGAGVINRKGREIQFSYKDLTARDEILERFPDPKASCPLFHE